VKQRVEELVTETVDQAAATGSAGDASEIVKGISGPNLQGVWDAHWYDQVREIVDATPTGNVQFELLDGRLGFVKRDADGNLQAYLGRVPCSSLRFLTTGCEVVGEPGLLSVSSVEVHGRTRRPGPHIFVSTQPHAS
jgi:hypothetical protein